MRQLCFFTHYSHFVKAAELVRLALRCGQRTAVVDADDVELLRNLLHVSTHGPPDIEQMNELLFILEGERDSMSDVYAHCAAGVVRQLVLVNERLLAMHTLMTYLTVGNMLHCDGKCQWPIEWVEEDNEPHRAVLEARRDELADYLDVVDHRFDMHFVRRQIGVLERAAFVELALGLATLKLPVLLVLTISEWTLRCNMDSHSILHDFKMPMLLQWRIAVSVRSATTCL